MLTHIQIVKWSKPDTGEQIKKTPAEYIGIIVPCSIHVTGKINLEILLQDKSADELLIVTSATRSGLLYILSALGKQFNNHFEIHIVECERTVSSIFNIPESELPAPIELKAHLQKITETYGCEHGGYLGVGSTLFALDNRKSTPIAITEVITEKSPLIEEIVEDSSQQAETEQKYSDETCRWCPLI